MHECGPSINVPEWNGKAKAVARLWHLSKKRRDANCALFTHPLGAEIRVNAGGEFVRSEAGRDALALVDLANTWKAQFQEKGWN